MKKFLFFESKEINFLIQAIDKNDAHNIIAKNAIIYDEEFLNYVNSKSLDDFAGMFYFQTEKEKNAYKFKSKIICSHDEVLRRIYVFFNDTDFAFEYINYFFQDGCLSKLYDKILIYIYLKIWSIMELIDLDEITVVK